MTLRNFWTLCLPQPHLQHRTLGSACACSVEWRLAQHEVGTATDSSQAGHALLDPAATLVPSASQGADCSVSGQDLTSGWLQVHAHHVGCTPAHPASGGLYAGKCWAVCQVGACAAEAAGRLLWLGACCSAGRPWAALWTQWVRQSARHDTERLQRRCTCIDRCRWHSPISVPAQDRLGCLRLLLGGHSPHRRRCTALRSSSSGGGGSGLRLCCCRLRQPLAQLASLCCWTG